MIMQWTPEACQHFGLTIMLMAQGVCKPDLRRLAVPPPYMVMRDDCQPTRAIISSQNDTPDQTPARKELVLRLVL